MKIDENDLRIPEWLEEQAHQHVVDADLFSFKNPVIPNPGQKTLRHGEAHRRLAYRR